MSDLTWTPVRVRLGQIKPWTHNPRMSTKAQAQRLIKSERELGQPQTLAVSPFVDGFCDLYDGHQRVAAWNTIKGADFEVWALQSNRPLDDDERRKISILLHTATGQWEWDKLAAWSAADLQEWGFDRETLQAWNNDANNLKEMLNTEQETQDAEPQIDRAAELLEKWQVSQGDLWQVDDHRLLCGDSTKREDVKRVMGEERALVFSDAPYGVEIVSTDKASGTIGFGGKLGFVGAGGMVPVNAYAPIVGDDTTDTAENFYKLCLEIGLSDFILWGGNYFTAFLPPSPCWLVWDKREGIPSNNFADCEIAWTSFDKPSRVYSHLWSGLLRKGNRKDEGERRMHPTQKPVGLTEKIMADFPASVVYDGFLGSGTTLVACQNLGRRGRAIEISPACVAVTLERMSQAFPGIEIKRLDT